METLLMILMVGACFLVFMSAGMMTFFLYEAIKAEIDYFRWRPKK